MRLVRPSRRSGCMSIVRRYISVPGRRSRRYSNREDAATLAGRVLNAVGGELFELSGGRKVGRTCSIGWAGFPWFVLEPAAGDYCGIFRLGDFGFFPAKKAGRNQAIGILAA